MPGVSIFFLVLFSISFHLLFYFTPIRKLQDIPNERSMHTKPVKRSAGMVFGILFILALIFFRSYLTETRIYSQVLFGSIFFLSVGLADDLFGLGFKIRLGAEAVFLFLLLYFFPLPTKVFGFPLTGILSIGLTSLYILSVVNVSNFMDGLDFYLGMAVIMVFINLLNTTGCSLENTSFSMFILLLASIAGFAVLNLPPAKVFMGDSGSLLLGFFISLSPFFLKSSECASSFQNEITLGIFLLPSFFFDGLFTILKRIKNKENIFQAHRKHLYQRVQIHKLFGKKRTLAAFHFWNFFSGILFLGFRSAGLPLWIPVTSVAVLSSAVWISADRFLSKKSAPVA